MDSENIVIIDVSVPELDSVALGCPADISCGDDCTCNDDVK